MTNNPTYNLTGKYPGNTFPVIMQIDKTTGISYDGNGDSIDNVSITSSWASTASFSTSASYSTGSVLGYGINNIITLTQAEYDALGTYSATTLYITT